MYAAKMFMEMDDGLSCIRTIRPPLSLETLFVHVAILVDGVCFAYALLYCIPLILAEPEHEVCVAYAFSGISNSLFHERERVLMQRVVDAHTWLT